MNKLKLFSFSFLLHISSFSWSQVLYNGSFEAVNLEGFPLSWLDVSSIKAFSVTSDTATVWSGHRSIHIQPYSNTKKESLMLYKKLYLGNIRGFTDVSIVFYYKKNSSSGNIQPFMRRACTSGQGSPGDLIFSAETVEKRGVMWTKATYNSAIDSNCKWVNIGLVAGNRLDAFVDDFEIYLNGNKLEDIPLKSFQFPSTQTIKYIRNNTRVLGIDTINFSDIDFSFLKEELGNARLVAFGESTHGTREFNVLREKMVRYLVEKMDFQLLIFENDFAGTLLAQQGLQKAATLQATMDSFFTRVHQTEELKSLFRYLSLHNKKNRRKKVTIMGSDVQNTLPPIDFIKRCVYADSTLNKLLSDVQNYSKKYRDYFTTDTLYKKVSALHEYYLANPQQTTGKYDKATITQVFHALKDAAFSIHQYYRYTKENVREDLGLACRDSLMAKYVEWAVQHSGGKKAILWFHNSHIQKNSGDTAVVQGVYRSMGGMLSSKYGEQYKAFAFMTYTGNVTGYTSRGVPAVSNLLPPDSTCYEYYFVNKNQPLVYISNRNYSLAGQDEVSLKDLRWRQLGFGVAAKDQFQYFHMQKKFDGVFMFRTTTHANSFHLKKEVTQW